MGHNALGAGQLIDQGASLVDNALRTGSMFSGEGWQVRNHWALAVGALQWLWSRSDAAWNWCCRLLHTRLQVLLTGAERCVGTCPPARPAQYITPSFADNTLHFIGLLSDGGVHSRTDQL